MNDKDILRESTSNKREEKKKEDAMRVFNPLIHIRVLSRELDPS